MLPGALCVDLAIVVCCGEVELLNTHAELVCPVRPNVTDAAGTLTGVGIIMPAKGRGRE